MDKSMFYRDKTKSRGFDYRCKSCLYSCTTDKIRCYRKNWNKKHKSSISRAAQEYKKRNPKKQKSRVIFHKALKKGVIIKRPCQVCGEEKSHGHHTNYNKPLEVMWLCAQHHKDAHYGRL